MALPSIPMANLAEAVQQSKFTPAAGGGDEIFCKFDYQTGVYLLGREALNIAGEEVTIHTDSISVGWVCWSGGKPNKKLVNFTQELPEQPAPIGLDQYVEARAIMFKTDEGEQVILEGNSYGIRSGIDDLIMKIKQQAADPANAEYLYPKVVLSSNDYKHSTGNTIFNMVLTIISWCNVDGEVQVETDALQGEVEEAKAQATASTTAPTRRRRKAA